MTVVLTQAKHGRFLVLDNDYWIGRLLLRDGEYSEGEVDLFSKIVGPDDVVIEAGANIGAHTVPLAKLAKSVVAWEPQRFIFNMLCGNLALNGLTNVAAYPAGLGAQTGHMLPPKLNYDKLFNFGGVPLRQSWESDSTYQADDPVAIYALDQLHLREVRLIKADVEGMEVDVVRGAKETILRCRPYLYLEDDGEGERSAILRSAVQLLNYRVIKHQIVLVGPEDEFNQHPGCVIASKNILCVPNELPDPLGVV